MLIELEVAKEGLRAAMGEMLDIIKMRERSGQIIKSIQIASRCMMICSSAFPRQFKNSFDTLLAKSTLKVRADGLVHKENSRKVYGLNDLIRKALHHYDAHISLLSINLESVQMQLCNFMIC